MYKKLKTIRVVFALILFILITISFLNFAGIDTVSAFLLKTQFTPAFISIFTGSFLAFALLFIITLLFGRVYCSFLCPLGILQDIITRIATFFRKKANKGKLSKKGSGYKKPHNIIRYSILSITALFFFAGITTPLVLLDPYSNYGTMVIQLLGTVELWINNMLSNIFPQVFYYQQYVRLAMHAFLYALLIFITVSVFSMLRGRLYCNTICPVGSLLGLISGFSLFKPVIKKSMCVRCNACAVACKSNCINLETKEIDVTRCVSCFNCMTSCKRGGVELVPVWFKKRTNTSQEGEETAVEHGRGIECVERRNALIAIGALASGIAVKKIMETKETLSAHSTGVKEANNLSPIAPPGAGNIERFKDHCTACHACIAVCPNKIIKPAVLEYGLDGFMIPLIKYDKKFCAYDCNKCSQICPHGALEHLSLEQKQITQIGRAKYVAKNCIVFKDGTDCGACDEHCPTKAIVMTEIQGKPGLFFPKLNRDMCIGCGACEYICPESPKAIVVEGNSVQTEALPPTIEKQEEKKVDGFGF